MKKTHSELVTLLSLIEDNGGATLKNGETVTYPNGFQVADYGKETKSAEEAATFIEEMDGDAGIWRSNDVFYIDHSIRIEDLEDAIEYGREHDQQSILKWDDMSLIWLNEAKE